MSKNRTRNRRSATVCLMLPWLAGLLLVPVAPSAVALAQPPPGIAENPDGAVRLRTIWVKTGAGQDSTTIGRGYGSVGDINNDGFDDFFVSRSVDWYLYLGGTVPADTAAWSWKTNALRFSSSPTPIIGDFYGTGERLLALRDDSCTPRNGVCYFRLRFFRPDPDSLLVPAGLSLNVERQPSWLRTMVVDLDKDGADDLVIVNQEGDDGNDAVVRIYEGGEDFDLLQPRNEFMWVDQFDPESSRSHYSSIADYDGDFIPDLCIGRLEAATFDGMISFWWGSDGPFTWDSVASREFFTPAKTVGPDPIYPLIPEDLDGDAIPEVFRGIQFGDNPGTYVWLSRNRESIRTREFTAETADRFYPNAVRNRGFGYVADSLERYEMMVLLGERDAFGLGGGLNGPNNTYDAHFGGGDGPAFGGVDAGDVNGDGWRDRLIVSDSYGGPRVGRAVVVAGGPYIPVDDPTVSVRSEPVAGDPQGLSLWPNPTTDRLNLAWRGNLPSMPHRVVVVDAGGSTLLDRGLPTWKGSTTIDVEGFPSGGYRLSLFDIDGFVIHSSSFVVAR